MKLYLTSDHGGFSLKEKLKDIFQNEKIEYEDLGPKTSNPSDDSPDYIFNFSEKIASVPDLFGIACCRSGVGEAIAANKVKGIRASVSFSPEHVAKARQDDNINVLCLPADYISLDLAYEIVETFIETPFSFAERHVRRLKKIEEYENIH